MSDFVNITRNNNDIISTYTNNQNDEGGDEGIASLVASLAQSMTRNGEIDAYNPPSNLAPLSSSNTPLQNTNNLQAIINYALANYYDVVISKDTQLQPILQPDGTRVCIIVDDGASGNYRRSFKLSAKQEVVITTNETVNVHTVFRWRMYFSTLENIKVVGTRSVTNVLELCRKNTLDANLSTECVENNFINLRMDSFKTGIIMEGNSYYNKFDHINFLNGDTCIWLKRTYAFDAGNETFCSGVNRNNFYNCNGYGCINGILLDYGDTNKFYSCAFEGLSGTAVTVNDQVAAHPNLGYTEWNTFFGTTTESCNQTLVLNADGNSFIDFTGSMASMVWNKRPAIYIPSGDRYQNHLFFQQFIQTNDADILTYQKNRTFIEYPLYVGNISDYSGTGSDGKVKGYGWRTFPFVATDCTNVASLQHNTSYTPLYKVLGGIVYYYAKLSIIPTVATNAIKLPLPSVKPYDQMYNYFSNVPGVIAVGWEKDGANPILLPATIDNTGINIPAPSGGWSTTAGGNANVLLININYVKQLTNADFADTN